ncbi:MAG: hypothetical protein IJF18_02500 [Oscillospiraceae bacterium]|nr:hypothetical protein [Oscillospiraceae bacterium]
MGKDSKKKKSRGFGFLIVLIIIAVIVAALLLLSKGGFGFGGGSSGDGDSVQVNATVSETAAETATEEAVTEEITYIEITISENTYIYQNRQAELDELIAELTSSADNAPVKITDDNASQDAYSKLIGALEENNISFIE